MERAAGQVVLSPSQWRKRNTSRRRGGHKKYIYNQDKLLWHSPNLRFYIIRTAESIYRLDIGNSQTENEIHLVESYDGYFGNRIRQNLGN